MKHTFREKKGRGRSEGDLPLHSFQALMAEVATRTRNECRVSGDPDGPLVTQVADATELQQRVFDLWRAFPAGNSAAGAREGG